MAVKENRIGLTRDQYKGKPSTLCAGCGHDSISNQIVTACFELGLDPYDLAKMSGIGCSSKTPGYFLGTAAGVNAVHGRMPAVATGAALAHRGLRLIGVSGDGDTASIGMGQFIHMVRRDVPMLYIIENNGVYGLTKGQFSATADEGSAQKGGDINDMPPIDCCALAIQLGCRFVARSFSGDVKQLSVLIKAGLSHRGTALLDVISPCVAFNNHPGSTKSWDWSKEHELPLHELGYVPFFEEIQVEYPEGSTREVRLHDGSRLTLRKLDRDYDPGDRMAALTALDAAHRDKELLTGLLHYGGDRPDFIEHCDLVDEPLARLPQERLRPSADSLRAVVDGLR